MEAQQHKFGKPGTIHVKSTVYPGTKIIIGDTVFEVKEKFSDVVFYKQGDEIYAFELHSALETRYEK